MAKQNILGEWDPFQAVLAVAAAFAFGSIGFFCAIFFIGLNSSSHTTPVPVQEELSTGQKQQLLAGLSSTSTATSTNSQGGGLTAAEKLKLLQGLAN
ncbi:MAG TPA: hypothetical protein VMU27_02670 [Candidatus Paceibacterota bacterium]|nr:hypothetical protein [Candidatus Paceibacterota bacterium]